MKFEIVKEEEGGEILYWIYPKGILGFFISSTFLGNLFLSDKYDKAFDCFNTLEEAKEHVDRFNNGYYKTKKKVIGSYGK